ncbi:uncharacterized protein LOC125940774 [Dermacentor silvarum]|uniref:uncharacterized protein LOC125940774 n=1 Tax=Dermacentor silvarum TaxID=543639 RepID=UPI0021015706|nr:uncharacterized protein LOC125940774 [Dermacentor silvarum]
MCGRVHLVLALTVTAVLYRYTDAGDCSTEDCSYLHFQVFEDFKFIILNATSDQQLDLRCLTVKKLPPITIDYESTIRSASNPSYQVKYMKNDDEIRSSQVRVSFPERKISVAWESETLQFDLRFYYEKTCFVLEKIAQGDSGSKYYLFSNVNAKDTGFEQCMTKLKEYSGGNVTFPNEGQNCDRVVEQFGKDPQYF